jgi:hypothetical protein
MTRHTLPRCHIVLFPPNSEGNLLMTQPAPKITKQVILVVDDDEAVRISSKHDEE